MNDKHINKILLAVVESSQISFDYSTPSGSNIRFKGTPLLLRSNKAGDFVLAAKRAGYGYATWSVNRIKNLRVYNESNNKVKAK